VRSLRGLDETPGTGEDGAPVARGRGTGRRPRLREEYTLAELDSAAISGILRRAYVDHRVEDDMVVIDGDFLHTVHVDPEVEVLRIGAVFASRAPFLDILAFVNRFNREVSLVKCYAEDDRDVDADWRLVFELDHWAAPEGHVGAERIVKLVRQFPGIVHFGISEADRDRRVFPLAGDGEAEGIADE